MEEQAMEIKNKEIACKLYQALCLRKSSRA